MMKNKLRMSMLNNNGPSIEPWSTPDIISCHEVYVSDILVLCLNEKLDNHKQTSRPYCQNHMHSILQSIIYVEDSQKLLEGQFVNPQRHALGLHFPSTFQGELLWSAKHCGPS